MERLAVNQERIVELIGFIGSDGRPVETALRILLFLGAGAYGDVWKVEAPMGVYALKVPHAPPVTATASSRTLRNTIDRESKALLLSRTIDGVCRFNYFIKFKDESAYGILMDFVEGDNLATILRERQERQGLPNRGTSPRASLLGKLSRGETLALGARLLSVASHLHAQQNGEGKVLVHGDLKPENIIVPFVSSGRSEKNYEYHKAQLVDFGVAQFASTLHWVNRIDGNVGGTIGFAPLEHFSGALGPSSDVFAIAVILYRCLAGKSPWDIEAQLPTRSDGLTATTVYNQAMIERAEQVMRGTPARPIRLSEGGWRVMGWRRFFSLTLADGDGTRVATTGDAYKALLRIEHDTGLFRRIIYVAGLVLLGLFLVRFLWKASGWCPPPMRRCAGECTTIGEVGECSNGKVCAADDRGGEPSSRGVCECPYGLKWNSDQNKCLDLSHDRENCGVPGHRCRIDEQSCIQGVCRCPEDGDVCGDVCRSRGWFQNGGDDGASNCGQCGVECKETQRCTSGHCQDLCAIYGLYRCDTRCVDLKHDPLNCGSCDNACPPSAVCFTDNDGTRCRCDNEYEWDDVLKLCVHEDLGKKVECLESARVCNNTCTDIRFDRDNCGACRRSCHRSQICNDGTCECMPGFALKNGICRDTATDVRCCGDQCRTCLPQERCERGECQRVVSPSPESTD